MRKVRALVRRAQVLVIALLISLIRNEPVSAQDRANIEIVPILGHSAPVYSVAFSADGRRVSGETGRP